MTRGVGPEGEHLYPSFPYGSYARMTPKDVNDLYGYIRTLPKSTNVAAAHELPFPFNIRLLLGGWKLLFFTDKPRVTVDTSNPVLARGQYLVEGPAIAANATRRATRSAASKTASGWPARRTPKARAPSLTSRGVCRHWRLERGRHCHLPRNGFTPEFDSVGGSMVEVQKNMAKLTAEDRQAIAAYLKAVPAVK